MSQAALCIDCGRPVPADAQHRLCPTCLLKAALLPDSLTGECDDTDDTRKSLDLFAHPWKHDTHSAVDERDSPAGTHSEHPGEVNAEVDGVPNNTEPTATFFAHDLDRAASPGSRHANVVQIFDVGEVGGLPYFSLELLEGGTLKERLSAGPMATRPAAELLMVLARAVGAAHHAGIVHRDLKPSNVLFDIEGSPKIADFGLAKRLDVEEGQTITGQVMGTPSHMAPEQASGKNREVGPCADINALGAVLYEVVTGRPPFKGTSTSETLLMVISEDPVPPSRLQPRLPRDLETICLKCLAKEPARRYTTALELAADLGRYLDGKPILARPTPALERAAKWARRRPAAAILITLSFAAFLGLTLGGIVYEHNLRVTETGLNRQIEEGKDAGNRLIDQARESTSQEALRQWEIDTSKWQETIKNIKHDGRLDDVRSRVEASLTMVQNRLNHSCDSGCALSQPGLALRPAQGSDARAAHRRAW